MGAQKRNKIERSLDTHTRCALGRFGGLNKAKYPLTDQKPASGFTHVQPLKWLAVAKPMNNLHASAGSLYTDNRLLGALDEVDIEV